MQLLFLFCLASSAFALKTPTLCADGKGNEFVCSVIEPVNNEDSYSKFPSIGNLTIGTDGQAEFVKSTQALEILRSSLKDKASTEALKTNPRSWFETLSKVSKQLESAKTETQKLANSVGSGLNNLQASFEKTTTANANKVNETAADAIKKLSQQTDQKEITYYSDDYKTAVEKCKSTISKQVETLQNNSKKLVERSYDSLIDLTDQIGQCIQNNDTQGKCARTVGTKLNGSKSLATTAKIYASRFEALGKRNFEKDACLTSALRRFENNVKTILKTAQKND